METSKTNICQFTFVAQPSHVSVDVTGVERTWDFLKLEFDRHSDGLPIQAARYYQTLYAGPRLFGVDKNDVVYYHDQEKWIPFKTAKNVMHSYDPDFVDAQGECDIGQTASPNSNAQEIINKARVSLFRILPSGCSIHMILFSTSCHVLWLAGS